MTTIITDGAIVTAALNWRTEEVGQARDRAGVDVQPLVVVETAEGLG